MPKTRDIRRRIRGVRNTRKITHAMELVAATNMRRAAAAVLATRRYAELAHELLRDVQTHGETAQHPLLRGRVPVRETLLLVIAGNRGLVGALNQKIVHLALAALRAEKVPVRVMTAGRVAARLLRRAGVAVVADYPKKDLLAEPRDAAPITAELLRQFLDHGVDRVRLVYADFHSAARQEPVVRTVLPAGTWNEPRGARREFLFEPSPREVLGAIVPNLVSIQVYQALLETTAAEHGARMVAMKNATDNADELGDELTLTLNQARQQQITQELQEIVSASVTVE